MRTLEIETKPDIDKILTILSEILTDKYKVRVIMK